MSALQSILETATEFARAKHNGQFRFDGRTPYFWHVEDVIKRCKTVDQKIVAALHDTMEDCGVTREDLEQIGIPEDCIQAVILLTKKEGILYDWYLSELKRNPLARKVKIADMISNLSDKPTINQIIKYGTGLMHLGKAEKGGSND